MNVAIENLRLLQAKQERVRNLCILAHVDHGKTTLSDHLIGSNGLIHPKMMGELRYLDSRDDEQARGITMKSSSISLLYVPGVAGRPEGPKSVTPQEQLASGYLINLIDSPGHVDFCSEVSTAVRLSDGGLVVVDAVEGVCIQTHAVLRQAWEEKVTPCLFINKIDRLILELRLTPAEAAARLASIVTHANLVMSAFHSEKYMSEADAVLAYEAAKEQQADGADGDETPQPQAHTLDDDDQEDVFQPPRCNVAFGSAHDGWAFRLDQFAEMYAEKLGCRPEALTKALWGDWHFSVKDKRVVRASRKEGGAKLKTMFVQFALEPIWKAYTSCDPGEDVASTLGAIVKGRGLAQQVPPKALEHPDPRQALRSVMRAWLPLSEAVLGMAITHLPSPAAAAPTRMPRLLNATPGHLGALESELPADVAAAVRATEAALAVGSNDPGAPTVIYVSKMVSVPAGTLPRLPGEPYPSTPEVFLAFGRVYSGVAREGQRVHVLSSAYSPGQPRAHRQTAVLQAVYMMMGRGLERLQSVPAGNVLAIAGLEQSILKSATLCSSPACRPLAPLIFQSAPIVKVAVEPARPHEMPQLAEGLRLLNRADPFVEVSVMETGEHVLAAAGEVHLETCIKDLRERFAKIELQVSAPLVAFRETVLCPAEASAETTPRPVRVVEIATPSGAATVRVRANPLPGAVASALDDQADLLRRAVADRRTKHGATASSAAAAAAATASSSSSGPGAACSTSGSSVAGAEALGAAGSAVEGMSSLAEKLQSICQEANDLKALQLLQRAWLLGPKHVGPNVLLPSAHPGALFEVPPTSVLKVAKRDANMGPSATAQMVPSGTSGTTAVHHLAEQDHEGAGAEVGPTKATLDLKLGRPEAAEVLGMAQADAAVAVSAGANGTGAHSAAASSHSLPAEYGHLAYSIESGVVAGFQMATSVGPLCEEPMWGVALEIDVRINYTPAAEAGAAASEPPPPPSPSSSSSLQHQQQGPPAIAKLELAEEVYGPFSGQVMTAVAAACRRAVLEADPRLVEAMYLCQVQTSAEALSGVYAVLGRRRARILKEEMKEGSDTFLVHAYLPVEASFGLADEMRRKSSGAASASLLLSHWERLQVDPFFVPTTEEEREEHGEDGSGMAATNLARKLINAVRRRKGLPVEEKVVKAATKQRTLAKKV